MTKEENISTLNEHLDHWKRLLSEKICDQDEGEKTIDALQNAIKALEQDPCGDVVSRSAVIDTLTKTSGIRGDALKALYDLPSVTAQPKIGQWIYTGDYITDGMLKCSECGFEHDVSEMFSYCPYCGANMSEIPTVAESGVQDADSN